MSAGRTFECVIRVKLSDKLTDDKARALVVSELRRWWGEYAVEVATCTRLPDCPKCGTAMVPGMVTVGTFTCPVCGTLGRPVQS